MSEDYYKILIKDIIENNDKEETIKIIANKLNKKQMSNEKEILANIEKAIEIERLHSIIKEVREYLDTLEKQRAYKFVEVDNHIEMRIDENEYLVWCKYNKLLNILDKGE